jgi:choline dehydrogenase-like flavoprotein
MLIDARAFEGGETFDADVCVLGAGAAGITLARELAAPGRIIALMESGGFDYDEQTQSLYGGPTSESAPRTEADYLKSSRLRYLGGTTNHWEGWCRKFDAVDFEVRPWVPKSGWPITLEQLEPYYRRACEHLQIPSLDDAPLGPEAEPDRWLFPPNAGMRTTFFRQTTAMRIGSHYRKELIDSPSIRLHLWANAVDIEADEAGNRIERVGFATLSGKRFQVRARTFVVATGAIEAARLLLASNRVHAAGLGNQNDMVGRCFMEHPRFENAGTVVILRRGRALETYAPRQIDKHHTLWGALVAAPEVQREHGLLNACFGFQAGRAPDPVSEIAALARSVDRREGRHKTRAPISFAAITLNSEQAPNRDSRVTLANDRDPFGHPRARLDWRMTQLDRDSMRAWFDFLARELGRSGLGRAAYAVREDDPWRNVLTSAHHIGTTRMSNDPKDGVVDASLRVHGLANLYVASSATFPTSGLASPTPTIVALTIRLADHLEEKLE